MDAIIRAGGLCTDIAKHVTSSSESPPGCLYHIGKSSSKILLTFLFKKGNFGRELSCRSECQFICYIQEQDHGAMQDEKHSIKCI